MATNKNSGKGIARGSGSKKPWRSKSKSLQKKAKEIKRKGKYMYKCPKCGNTDLREATEFNKARCHFQFLIDHRLFCYHCQMNNIKQILDNPSKSCDDCEFMSPVCPAGYFVRLGSE